MPRRHPCALLLPMLLGIGTFTGCSSTSGLRTAERPEPRTIALVGDRALPPVSGVPGASKAASEVAPEPRLSPRSRVSGRVFDEKGKPVPDAIVRPASGGSAGGRLIEATTDRSGAFTLHGLRPGTNYTLVAEYNTADGLKTGRVDVQSSDSSVEISLGPSKEDSSSSGDEASRARSVSNREELPEPEFQPRKKAPDKPSKVNIEDIPTTEELEAKQEERELETSATRPARPASSTPATSWRSKSATASPTVENRSTTRVDRAKTQADADAFAEPPPARDARTIAPNGPADDDAENPLPPAIDPRERTRPAPKTSAADPASRSSGTASKIPTRNDAEAGGLALAKPEPSPSSAPFSWDETVNASANVTHTEPARKVTWSDLPEPSTKPLPAVLSSIPPSPPDISRRLATANAPPPRGSGVAIESCRFDPRQRRLTDFRLPDLEGRPVSFQGLDADYVLLDFWGSWCRPCLTSIPSLVEAQKKYGKQKLLVVGIACEKGTFDQRAAKASAAAEKLAVNYPILVSSAEDYSPLQESLGIRTFPTLILVDRQGRVVWREQGASQVTLARLDRVLESSAKGEIARR